jgi:LytS/YehU family sensor histidine kinase
VTVQDELDHITNYLAIEEVRLGERLKLALHAEPTVLRCSILPLTLLPLVENAVKHGIDQCLEGGTLSISIRPDSGFLWVEVKNPIEKPVRPVRGDGLGLETLKKRIEVYYGPAGRVTVDRGEETFNVKLRLPLNREAEDGN